VKKIIDYIASRKDIAATLIIIFLVIAGAAAYCVYGIYENVQKLQNAEPEDVTYFPTYPKINTQGKNSDQIKRGEYLVKAGDCAACHTNTAEKGPIFAGRLAMPTPFGTIYTPNITPDKETGIGGWTDEQFIKAMREGISPQGHYYYPAFPFYYFNKVSTEDLKAIKAYLDNIPAVKQKNLENDMAWPFNYRIFQLGWRILFFNRENTGPMPADPNQTAQWNRGAYLTGGLGHCAMCHSPSYHLISKELPLGAPMSTYSLTGAKVQGYLAPNITSLNFGNVSEQDIIDVFKKDKMVGGGHIEGPMLEVNKDSLSYLTDADLAAIAHYLKTVKSQLPPKPKMSGGPGKGIYEMYCSGCHAQGAGGAPRYGDPNNWTPIMKNGIEKVYLNAIQGVGGMPAKGTCLSCTDEEVKQAVDYMVASVKGKEAAAPVKILTAEDGKNIYNTNCAICHANGYKNAPIPGNKKAWQPIIDQGFVETYSNVITGKKGHIPHGACPTCSDAEIIAAMKYMLQQSTTSKSTNFRLW